MASSEYMTPLAFTLTLLPKEYKYKPNTQLWHAVNEIESILDHHGHKYSLCYELTKAYNVHFHGLIDLNRETLRGRDPFLYWYNLWRGSTVCGYSVIKQIEDEPKWIEYILKDVLRTQEILPLFAHPILKDKHNLMLTHLGEEKCREA